MAMSSKKSVVRKSRVMGKKSRVAGKKPKATKKRVKNAKKRTMRKKSYKKQKGGARPMFGFNVGGITSPNLGMGNIQLTGI